MVCAITPATAPAALRERERVRERKRGRGVGEREKIMRKGDKRDISVRGNGKGKKETG